MFILGHVIQDGRPSTTLRNLYWSITLNWNNILTSKSACELPTAPHMIFFSKMCGFCKYHELQILFNCQNFFLQTQACNTSIFRNIVSNKMLQNFFTKFLIFVKLAKLGISCIIFRKLNPSWDFFLAITEEPLDRLRWTCRNIFSTLNY